MDEIKQVDLVEDLGHQVTIELKQNGLGEWIPSILISGERIAMAAIPFRKREDARQYAFGLAKAKIVASAWSR